MVLPLDISGNGQYIAGIGKDVNEDMRGFVIKLPKKELSTQEVQQDNAVQVYPNPVKDIATIKTKDAILSVEAMDFTGRKVGNLKK